MYFFYAGAKSARQHSASYEVPDSAGFPACYIHDLAGVSSAAADSLSLSSAP